MIQKGGLDLWLDDSHRFMMETNASTFQRNFCMNRLHRFFRFAALSFALSICEIASGAAFTNGSFETSNLPGNAFASNLNPSGDTRVTGWTYRNPGFADAYHLASPSFNVLAGAGDRWILFGGLGSTGDILEQNFDTVIGNIYGFRFQTTITQFGGSTPPAQSLRVDFLDNVLNLLPGGGTHNVLSQTNGVWLLSNLFSFTATTTTSTIRFTDTSNGAAAVGLNIGLDGTQFTETSPMATSGIPEPSTLAFAASGLLALGMYRTFGRAKK